MARAGFQIGDELCKAISRHLDLEKKPNDGLPFDREAIKPSQPALKGLGIHNATPC